MKRVLIAEDDKFIANAYRAKLEKAGFELQMAGDGEEVLKILEAWAPDLILLDLIMPKRDGFSVLEEIKKSPKVEIMLNFQTLEILGGQTVTGMKYADRKTNEEKELAVQGVFVEIGSVPNSEMVKELVALDTFGQVIIDSKHGTTSRPGVFAAGDITDDPYKQNNISAGDAVKAALAAYAYLLKR